MGDNTEPLAEETSEAGYGDLKLDLADVDRDGAGVPTFVFEDSLTADDKPTQEKKTLEVVMYWRQAVMSVGHYAKPQAITIGGASKNDFRVVTEGLAFDRFNLLEPEDDRFAVQWVPGMSIEVRGADGEVLVEEELRQRNLVHEPELASEASHRYVVGLHDRVAIQVGDLTFVIQYVSPARLIATSLWKSIDLYFTRILGLSFLAHLFVLLALLLTPFDPSPVPDDLFKNPNRFAKLILSQPPKPKVKQDLSGSKGGGRHKGDEGKFGKQDKKPKDALASVKGAPKVDPNKREKDRKVAYSSGILAALSGGEEGAVSNVFGPGGLGTGINKALGGLRGTAMGDAGGSGGLGMRGTGKGGGGKSLGIGGLGSGTGRGTGGLGTIDLGGRGKDRFRVIPGRTITKGCLSQQQVARVIGRANNQLRYCYEKELSKNPNLSGKIVAEFVIGPTGTVMKISAAENTMGDLNVEQCVMRQLQRMKFPPCAGGGTAEIRYPLVFKQGGT